MKRSKQTLKNFASANLRLKDDPFEIYETTLHGASFSIDGKYLFYEPMGWN